MKKLLQRIWKDESAQGATEYILLLVVVVTIAIIFKDKIQGIIRGKVDELGSGMDAFKVGQ